MFATNCKFAVKNQKIPRTNYFLLKLNLVININININNMSMDNYIPARGLTARSLFQKSNREIIRAIVQDQVKSIDSQIAAAHSSGFNRIEHELPMNFNINNLDKADAQIMIYSEILSIYKSPEPDGKGFDEVYIDLGVKKTLHIRWLNGMDEIERAPPRQLISSCTLPRISRK